MNGRLRWQNVAYLALRTTYLVLAVAACCSLLAACRFPGSVLPTVKIGLSAPFEGQHRDLGYEVLYAVRLAVRQRNEAGGVGGSYLVELVALNDFNEPEEARWQARKMAADPGILGVLGGWSPETARSAAPEYERLDLAFLTPGADSIADLVETPFDPEFEGEYRILSGGVSPGPVAAWAYAEANRLLDALEAAGHAEGRLTRTSVRATLTASY